MTDLKHVDLYKTQLQLENEMKQLGTDYINAQFEKAVQKGYENSMIYGVKLQKSLYTQGVEILKDYCEKQQQSKRKSQFYAEIMTHPEAIEQFAFHFSRLLITELHKGVKQNSFTTRVLHTIKHSLGIKDYNRVQDETLIVSGAVSVVKLLTDNIQEIEERRDSVRSPICIVFKDEVLKMCDNLMALIAEEEVKYTPMVVEPRNHTSLFDNQGGYLSIPSPLFNKVKKIENKIPSVLKEFNDPTFFSVINHYQKIPFKIDTEVLEIVSELNSKGFEFKGLSNIGVMLKEAENNAQEEIQQLNQDAVDTFGENAYLLSERQQRDIRLKHNKIAASKVRCYDKAIEIANKYKEFSKIYFPMYLDYRGRIYYYPNGLEPQGNALQKALLQFGEGQKLNFNGIQALKVAFANACGMDKKTRQVRLTFTNSHLKAIMEFGKTKDIKHLQDILDEDEALIGIGLALDIFKFYTNPEFKCFRPVHIDACNSAVQIQSLFQMDAKAAGMTNILNVQGEDLEDAYKIVAENLKARMESEGNERMLKFPEIYNRKVFKLPVMCVPNYGAKKDTCNRAVCAVIAEKHPEAWEYLAEGKSLKSLEWTSPDGQSVLIVKNLPLLKEFLDNVWEQIRMDLPASMYFLKEADSFIRAVTKRDKHFSYINPVTNFPVIYAAYKEEEMEIQYTELFTRKRKRAVFKTQTLEVSEASTASTMVPGIN